MASLVVVTQDEGEVSWCLLLPEEHPCSRRWCFLSSSISLLENVVCANLELSVD